VVAAWGFLEWFFVIALLGLTGAVGLVFVYIVAQLFLNPGRKAKRT
jgi:phage shock protein PspC (stress-responsive transcriptional regulator)